MPNNTTANKRVISPYGWDDTPKFNSDYHKTVETTTDWYRYCERKARGYSIKYVGPAIGGNRG